MTDRHSVSMFPALTLMERRLPPGRYGRPPFWRAPITPPSHDSYVPAWNWVGIHEVPEGAELLTLDTNAAYLGALGTVTVAHSHLTQRGAPIGLPAPREVDPGYYLIKTPYWAFSGTIVSPLGDSSRLQSEDALWVAHPTLVLLLELHEVGAIGEVTIFDSYTAQTRCGFRAWVDKLKEVRSELLGTLARIHPHGAPHACECESCDRYSAFKEGYSAALSMMLTGEKCQTRRPDWVHAVYAQHAATQWRKAWRFTETGRPLIAMGHTDEITILRDDLEQALERSKPPFRFDPTGHRIGALKPKKVTTALPTRAEDEAFMDDATEIL